MKIIETKTKANIYAQYLWCQLSVPEIYTGFTCQLVLNNFTTSFANGMTIGTAIQYNGKLILKPLSAITHEDAIELAKIHWKDSIIEPSNILILPKGSDLTIIEYKKAEYDSDYLWLENRMEKKLYIFQYLQSKGYALPYLNYSVEELVEAGVYLLEN